MTSFKRISNRVVGNEIPHWTVQGIARSGRFPDREDSLDFFPIGNLFLPDWEELRFSFTKQKLKCAKNTKRSTETDFCTMKCWIIGRYLGTLEKFLSTRFTMIMHQKSYF